MPIAVYSAELVDQLAGQARGAARLRQHYNLHADYSDPCQRLFNAVQPESYIPPHRHLSDPRLETMFAIRGWFVLLTFDEVGCVEESVEFGTSQEASGLAVGVAVPPGCWHTVLALCADSVLLEVKAGPFDPTRPKEIAPWAPDEGSAEAVIYLAQLRASAETRRTGSA